MTVSLALTQSLPARPVAWMRLISLALLGALALHAAPAPAAERASPLQAALRSGLEQDAAAGDLRAWYAARNFAPAWTDSHGLTANGHVALKTLAQVGNEGLPPARYALPAINGSAANTHDAARLARLDIALSRAVRQYIQDVQFGAANPHAPAGGLESLDQAASAKHLGRFLAEQRPHDPAYGRLRGILAAARAKADPASLARVQETILALEKMRWDRGSDKADRGTSVAWLDASAR